MNKTGDKPFYPESSYHAIFGPEVNLPPDAEETLEYVLGTLSKREADMFMLKYKDGLIYAKIGERCGSLSGGRVSQIIARAARNMRHPGRSKILLMGREAYLNSIAAVNEEKKRQYNERISALEELIKQQDKIIAHYQIKLHILNKQVHPIHSVLPMEIDILDLSTRSWNALTRVGIKTIKNILDFGDLSKVPNMGQISVKEVQDKMKTLTKKYRLAEQQLPSDFNSVFGS